MASETPPKWRPDWRPYNREAAALELLEMSAQVLDNRGSVPVAVALAAAGAQFFSDRLQRELKGEVSALFALADALETSGAPAGTAKWLRSTIHNRAGSIRHDDREGRTEQELLSPELAILLIFCSIGDRFRLTGEVSQYLLDFRSRWMQAMEAAGFDGGSLGADGLARAREIIGRWEAAG